MRGFFVLEMEMKSSYRQAVESVIAQEAKLAEVVTAHGDAAALEAQLAEALRSNQQTLERYEKRVSELESRLMQPPLQESESEV